MRPIKWKGILKGLTICYRKGDPSDFAQCTSLNMSENWKNWKFFKNRSLKYFLLPRSCLIMPWTMQIHKKTRVMSRHTQGVAETMALVGVAAQLRCFYYGKGLHSHNWDVSVMEQVCIRLNTPTIIVKFLWIVRAWFLNHGTPRPFFIMKYLTVLKLS